MSREVEGKMIQVNWGDSVINIHLGKLDLDMDVDELTKIHYHNLVGEMLTVSVLLNRVGVIRADCEDAAKRAKAHYDYKIADSREAIAQSLVEYTEDSKGQRKASKPTVAAIDAAISKDPALYSLKKIQLSKERDFAHMDNLYWSIKSKDGKINAMYHSLKPEDHEQYLVEEVINGMLIKRIKNTIK